ncbi:MAG: HAD family hydrolase [Acidobacteria bacterium]|nr:HAD family hydrolase [Acidobacteriota bacterium]
MNLRGLIFDLDGTLGDTLPICFDAFRVTFRHYLKREYNDKQIRAMFGPTEEGIFQDMFPGTWEDALGMYLREYRRAHATCREPFPGMPEALSLLRERQVRLAIVTGKGPGSAKISLQEMGLADAFEIVEAGSPRGGVKPDSMRKVLEVWNMKAEQVACIGDAPSDIRSAHEIGATPLGAAWAAGANYDALASLKPLHTFTATEQFREWIHNELP